MFLWFQKREKFPQMVKISRVVHDRVSNAFVLNATFKIEVQHLYYWVISLVGIKKLYFIQKVFKTEVGRMLSQNFDSNEFFFPLIESKLYFSKPAFFDGQQKSVPIVQKREVFELLFNFFLELN